MPTVLLVGTLDTKGSEYAFIRDLLHRSGVDTLVLDAGVLGDPGSLADIASSEVAGAGGSTLDALRAAGDRGAAVATMARGATAIALRLLGQGRLDGAFALGGTGGTTIASEVMRALPVGFPKLIVSTVAAGDTRPYLGGKDIALMYSVVDVAGLNSVSRPVLSNAAAAVAGMVTAAPAGTSPAVGPDRPVVAASMFGVTTPAVEAARRRLDELGYEVLVFHCTGVGGQSMEGIIEAGLVAGVLDLTTTELADELVGGVFSAGPTRLTAAGRAGIPQAVSFGALDMVNFGPRETVPPQFAGRRLHVHNATVTLMRTTPSENAELGRRLAERLNAAQGAVTVHVPLGGVSAIDCAGQPFHDPEADKALFTAFEQTIDARVSVLRRPTTINDPAFAVEMADSLHHSIQHTRASKGKH
jgi:uncharacterized protein (UPF0261 family)